MRGCKIKETIGIVGSRRRDDDASYQQVEKAFLMYYSLGDRIVSGGCPKGGDRFAELIAKKHQISITIYRPNWRLGKHAGFLRNTDIAKDSTILIACVAEDRKGGTEDTIRKFKKFHPKGKIVVLL